MKLYQGKVIDFKKTIEQKEIVQILSQNFFNYYGEQPSPSEKRAWMNSLKFVKNIFEVTNLDGNWLFIEYELPLSSKRIDLLLFGKDKTGKDSIVIMELKQWSKENIKSVEPNGNVIVQHIGEVPHPSVQVEGYYLYLKDFLTIFDNDEILLTGCVYCHNYSRNEDKGLYAPDFKDYLERFPLFSKDNVHELANFLKSKLGYGDGFEALKKFLNSPAKPSKKLLDHTSDMINKQQIFNLLDDQIVAYNSIMSKVNKASIHNEKYVFIIKGGPGTGKSAIALELMGELLRRGKTVFHATGSSAFTNTLRSILGPRARYLFKFFNSFTNHPENSIEVLLCDEAHRIRETSASRYTPRHLRFKTPQVEELIKAAKISVFFIDEFQVVRPNEIGSVKLIKDNALRLGIKTENIYEYELKTQFRCSGSNTYLQWLDNVLGIKQTQCEFLTKELKMEFKIFKDPLELKKAIDQKNKDKKNSARIVAGFCWPWSDPLPDGTLIKDVKVENLEMPWEKKDQFWKWATDDSGMEQVGTVYTAQGFEFDYVGVIFGNDLVWNREKERWEARPQNSYDTMVKRNNPNLVDHLKHVYRVLLSRAHKGVYVYFIDKDTEEYFRSKIKL